MWKKGLQEWGQTEINPCLFGQLIYDKGASLYSGLKAGSSINGVGKTTCNKKYVHSYTRINSKWIEDLNVRLETIKQRKQRQ